MALRMGLEGDVTLRIEVDPEGKVTRAEIIKSGGFGLLFEEQIYPLGHSALLKEAREHLLLKVQCPRDVKEGDMQRLLNWHVKRLARR